MAYEHPRHLLRRLKIGREEFCQRLVTMLILEASYPKWNTRNKPSARGLEFLRRVHEVCFGSGSWSDDLQFVDELELAPRTEDEQGGAPDQAVIWSNQLWMIELKTEKGSHRAAQIPLYFELGRYYYPGCAIDLTYITPPMSAEFSPQGVGLRYAHVTWPEVATLITDVWIGTEPERLLVEGLLDAVDQMTTESPSVHRQRVLQAIVPVEPAEPERDPVSEAVRLAEATARDGNQRALDYRAADLEELQNIRKEVREQICATPSDSEFRFVRPWLWRPESMGTPMTAVGRELGYELRVSRYRERVC